MNEVCQTKASKPTFVVAFLRPTLNQRLPKAANWPLSPCFKPAQYVSRKKKKEKEKKITRL
jgi:hypothetical protein